MNLRDASGLTPREKQIIRCLAQGQSRTETAHALGISVRTLANLLTTARYRTGTRNTTHLLAYAAQHDVL